MKVNSLQFTNFRNLNDNIIKPCEKVNVIYGNNAQGKTNLMEAIWLFCGGHSFRGAKETEFIKFGEKFAKLHMEFTSQNREQNADINYVNNKKEIKINGVNKNTGSCLIEKFSSVVFSPEHLSLIKNGPAQRRKFIDAALCQQSLRYAINLSKYNKIINQRNALLKDISKHSELANTLDIWDDSLCYFGGEVLFARLEYIEKLKYQAKEYHKGISDNKEDLSVSYISTNKGEYGEKKESLSDKIKKSLENSRSDDIYQGVTTKGLHRDDIDVEINGLKAKTFASQGQQRSTVISLKLSEAKLMSEALGETPVILFDDVMSELDKNRQYYLFNNINEYQVFITCCEKIEDGLFNNGKLFFIDKGNVE